MGHQKQFACSDRHRNGDKMFNSRGFLKFLHTGLFRTRDTNYRLTPKRIRWAIAFLTLYPLLEIITWACFLLDDLIFGQYRGQEVRQPVFIVGNPRSGTTFLHRLMAKDHENLVSMQTWEVFFAPSITQRKAWRGLSAIDRRLGSHLSRRIAAWEKQCQEWLVTHELAWQAPEEDEYVLVHAWSTLVTSLFSAVMDEAAAYTRFDQAIPRREKRRVMTFYLRCLQRHLYAHRAATRRYLAKSPASTPKVGTLLEWFPEAKFIYIARNPLETIPSYLSTMELTWRTMADPVDPWAARDYVLDMAHHWYSYPLERLAHAPTDSFVIVRYDDLVADPERTVTGIYRRLGLAINASFAQVLRDEATKARTYRSRHHYSLERMGLTPERIVHRFQDVFRRFGFDTKGVPVPQ
jgi:adenosyl cobinamide kinase/adenosyl cobinamide phosphate guanylyltransferase